MRKKGDLSDFECGMVVGARRAGLIISETADLLRFSHTTISRVTENGPKKRTFPVSGSCVDENSLLRGQRRMGRLVRDDRKATETQITTHVAQHVEP